MVELWVVMTVVLMELSVADQLVEMKAGQMVEPLGESMVVQMVGKKVAWTVKYLVVKSDEKKVVQ